MLETKDLERIAEVVQRSVRQETQPIKADIAELKADMNEVKTDIAGLKADVAVLKKDMEEAKSDIAVLKKDMEETKADVAELKADVAVLKKDMGGTKADVKGLKNDMRIAQSDIKTIQITLENETNKGIQIVAEGHRDLNRKLEAALKSEKEKEMMLLRTMHLENEVEKIKTKLEATA